MNKKYLIGLIILLAVIVTFFALNTLSQKENIENNQIPVKDYKNSSYIIEGQTVVLTNGLSEIESAPGSATKIITRYFGNEMKHDINNDGREDVVFLLTQERGGSGTFFYVVAALNTPKGYITSHAFFLGDRIAPQSINIDEELENVIVVNFATRRPDESMTTQPSVGKSVWIKLDPNTLQFVEVFKK